jgi:hypothetical protein
MERGPDDHDALDVGLVIMLFEALPFTEAAPRRSGARRNGAAPRRKTATPAS